MGDDDAAVRFTCIAENVILLLTEKDEKTADRNSPCSVIRHSISADANILFSLPSYSAKKVEKKQEIEEINVVVHETAHNKTVITYKKDFVPYPTRIYNFFQSFSSGPGGGASDK